jgi:glycosyltransferase involved in cell wall biosynthesis
MFAAVVRRHRLPLAFWLHSVTEGRHWTERWASRTSPDLLLCGSRDVARTAGALFPGVTPVVFYAPMPLTDAPGPGARATVRAELGATDDDVVIVQVGRMDPLKGQALLIDALAELRDVSHWHCWLAGGVQVAAEQAYADGLRARVAATGLEARVRFLGDRADVPRLLAGADIFCQPNQWSEGLSIVWMEAGQASLPIVTMRLGTAPEFVGDDAGVLLPPGDVQALATALRGLVEDAALRHRLGAGAHRRVHALCDPPTQIALLARLLADAAVAPGRTSRSASLSQTTGAAC